MPPRTLPALSAWLCLTGWVAVSLPAVAETAAPRSRPQTQAATPASTLPQALKTVQLVYPESADLNWSTGEVKLAFVVDAAGRVGAIEVLQGAHPAFTDAALDALLATPYRPATQGGTAVAMRVTRDYQFKLQNTGVGTVLELGRASARTTQRLELAPAVRRALWPVYPAALLRAGVTGTATLRAQLGAQGEVSAVELLGASHPDFGRAALVMMQAWQFEPPGAAGARELTYEQRFALDKPAQSGVPASAARLIERLAQGGAGIAGAGELDGPLRPVLQVAPTAPPSLRQARHAAQAVVTFFVDESGRVLLPELASSSQEDFGWAALTAVNQWRFEPPRRGGQPVVVRAQVALKVDAPQ
jgi:TonB family protein